MKGWKLRGLTRSIWFNKLSRQAYKNLPLPWHIKQRLKKIYLGQPGAWRTSHTDVFQLNKSQENLPLVVASAKQFDPADPWVLVVDLRIPIVGQDSSSVRMLAILHLLRETGFRITLVSDSESHLPHYKERLGKQGIEVLHGSYAAHSHLAAVGGKYRFVLLSQPEVAFQYLPYVRAYALYSKVIYDLVDIHWLRFECEMRVSSDATLTDVIARFRRIELFNTACADVILTISDEDKARLLIDQPHAEVAVLPNIYEIYPPTTPFAHRRGLLFIGNFLHKADENAVIYFVENVLPRITEKIPDLVFYIIGSNMPASVESLRSANVEPLGFVADTAPYFESCRVFVAPLGFDAGMESKVGQSMSHGLPVVTTQIGAEGMGLEHEKHVLIADNPQDFADRVIRLYSDVILWRKLSTAALAHLEANYSRGATQKRIIDIFSLPRNESRRDERHEDHNDAILANSARASPCSSTARGGAAGWIDVSGKQGERRVLVAGIYLADKKNVASHITRELADSSNWKVEQRWISLGRRQPDSDMAPFTVQVTETPSPKFLLLNQLLKTIDLHDFEYVIVSDDDIVLPAGFVDSYLALVSRHKFAVAQPARTHDSYIDHRFVEQLDGIDARWTRFVEIGPLFSLHRSAFDYFLPFDEASPMGWGNDFVWPILSEKYSLRMGIVDAVPVAHNLRKPVAYYDYGTSANDMRKHLAERPHLSKKEAFYIVESYV